MKRKQKYSLWLAGALAALALSAYMLVAPAKVSASCEFYAPCKSYNGTGCQSGSGYCWPNGSNNGIYVFCRGENGGSPGPGSCSSGCVTCRYGPY